jgi:cytochrome c biogenesis protein CcmG, thiol:disulfide interchange protein DsbE
MRQMQGFGKRFSALVLPALVAVAATLLGAAGCGSDGEPGGSAPDFSALDRAPEPLGSLYARGDELLPGGVPAFERQLQELRGTPVVVNKWASWCGPCRAEFPYFQAEAAERGTEIAFLGVDANDSEDAARTFLEDLPLPYPSFSDPDEEISELLEGAREFPSTAFYDSKGDLVYVKRGGYGSRADLAADIDRYAN